MRNSDENEWIPGLAYQKRDFEVIDYQMYCHNPSGLWLRGPEHKDLRIGNYIACIGAAQTFGCFCDQPFPRLLEKSLDIPVVNYGYGGAGPSFFLGQEKLFDSLNQAACVIVQVMSGRSESNSVFDTGGLAYLTRRADGHRLGARAAYQSLLWRKMVLDRKNLKRIIAETRDNWIRNYTLLLARIEVPVIMFWFSTRLPDYRERYFHVSTLLGGFPHLVNRSMMNAIKDSAAEYVQCVTHSGQPQKLISRFTQKPTRIDPGLLRKDMKGPLWKHNFYYPSPQMHGEAADLLAPVCAKYIP